MPASSEHQPKLRQLGITERPPEHLIVAAYSFVGTDPQTCRTDVEALRSLLQAELRDQLASPDTETGELGFTNGYDDYDLMITVGFSKPAYDKLGIATEARPQDLQPIPADLLDTTSAGQGPLLPGEGDVILKVCSDDIYVVEHVIRRVEHELAAHLQLVWAQSGVQRYNTRASNNPRHENRALIGFLDGLSNLDPSKADDRALIFTDHTRADYPPVPTSDQYNGATFPALRDPPAQAEPAALDGGSYMAVQLFLLQTASWDAQARAEQERSVGEDKQTGARLATIDVASHVAKANPGRPEDAARRFLRRGYSIIRPDGPNIARGLAFIAFGRTLSTQAEFVQRAWMNNPNFPHVEAGTDLLTRFVQPRLASGGFYFVPPLTKQSQPWSWVI
jgi:deferrochelatase/peroxidase EfeB